MSRQVVDVQLYRVRAGFLKETGVARPAAGAVPVQAGNDGNIHRRLGRFEQLEVLPLVPAELGQHGEKVQRLGVDKLRLIQNAAEQLRLVFNLLLEQRMERDSARPSVRHALEGLHITRERRSRGHDWAAQRQPQIRSCQRDHCGNSFPDEILSGIPESHEPLIISISNIFKKDSCVLRNSRPAEITQIQAIRARHQGQTLPRIRRVKQRKERVRPRR